MERENEELGVIGDRKDEALMEREDEELGLVGDRDKESNQEVDSPGSSPANSSPPLLIPLKVPTASDGTGEDAPDKEFPDCESQESPKRRCRLPVWVKVGPVIIVAMFAMSLQSPLVTQYIWDQMSADIGYNDTGSKGCNVLEDSTDPLQLEVADLTTRWNLCINTGGCVLGLLSAMLLGPWSDSVGRRPALILPAVGLALQAAVYLTVMYLKLHVGYFIIGRAISGITGDYNMFLAGCFAYVSDVSDHKHRAFLMAMLEACRGAVGVLASIIGGHWLEGQGIVYSIWFMFGVFLATPLYIYLCFEESITERKPSRLFTVQHYRSVFRLFTARAENKRGDIILYVLVFSLMLFVHAGMKELFVIYELSAPLCWGSDLIGYGSAAESLAKITSLVGLHLFQSCLADNWVAVLGILSNSSGFIVISLASTTPMMFTGYGLRVFAMTTTPVIRSKLSKLVDEGEQGVLVSLLAGVTGLAGLLGTAVFSFIYPATLHYMKGFPFLCGALLLLLPAGIIGLIEVFERKLKSSECKESQSQSDVETGIEEGGRGAVCELSYHGYEKRKPIHSPIFHNPEATCDGLSKSEDCYCGTTFAPNT